MAFVFFLFISLAAKGVLWASHFQSLASTVSHRNDFYWHFHIRAKQDCFPASCFHQSVRRFVSSCGPGGAQPSIFHPAVVRHCCRFFCPCRLGAWSACPTVQSLPSKAYGHRLQAVSTCDRPPSCHQSSLLQKLSSLCFLCKSKKKQLGLQIMWKNVYIVLSLRKKKKSQSRRACFCRFQKYLKVKLKYTSKGGRWDFLLFNSCLYQ